jgi:glycosyltransferase involved in cell wall biosynthesis
MADLSIFILTYNERVHIERCIRSAQRVAREVFLVDSGSDDGTAEIAQSLGAHVLHHTWENNHGRQTNWAIDNLPFTSAWVMRIDADEIITDALAEEINARLDLLPAEITGIVLKRRQVFMGRALLWGGNYPICLLRGFRRGYGRCEELWMDEHLLLTSGTTLTLDHDLEDHNLNDLRWWTIKEANYAVRAAADSILSRSANAPHEMPHDPSSRRKRWIKTHLYGRLPMFVRPAAYFTYRYLFRFGFLDGRPGVIWHFLQAFWYRFLIDAIVFDVERRAAIERRDALEILTSSYGLKRR